MLGLVVVALAVATSTTACGGSPRASSTGPSGPSAAFGRFLHSRYGAVHGYWTCPHAQQLKHRIDCLAEVRAGRAFHQASAVGTERGGDVSFANFHAVSWKRHWWPYSRQFIVRSHEPQVPGVISVNSPAYDWGFLASCANLQSGATRRCHAYDGDARGWGRFYTFACSARRGVVSCKNALGDVMRYRPRG